MDKVMELYVKSIAAVREAQKGQGMVEYALILALVSVVAIVILGTIGTNVVATFTAVAGAL